MIHLSCPVGRQLTSLNDCLSLCSTTLEIREGHPGVVASGVRELIGRWKSGRVEEFHLRGRSLFRLSYFVD